MPLTVKSIRVLDPYHCNGDPYWDGDQTLFELTADEGAGEEALLVVVPCGNAFIPPAQVAREVEYLGMTLEDLRAQSFKPGPRRGRQVDLLIEPGEETRVVGRT